MPKSASRLDALEAWAGSRGGVEDSPAIKLLRAENAVLRRKLSVNKGQADLVMDAFRELYQDPPDFRVPPPPKATRHKGTEIAVMHLTDTQIGKRTKSYDSEIAAGRVMEYAQRSGRCIQARRSHVNVDDLRLYLGGDLVEGEQIYAGQAFEIDSSVRDQAMRTAPEIISRTIIYMLQHVKRIHVVGVPGNHGRVGRKGEGHPSTNFDSMAMEMARALVNGKEGRHVRDIEKRVTWNLPDDWYAVDHIFGWKILLIHGDNLLTSVFGGSPFQRKLLSWRSGGLDGAENYDALFFGHYHVFTSGEVNNATWYCGGSTESDSAFAQRAIAARGWPKQRLQFWDAEHGQVADLKIYLTYGLDAAGNALPRARKALAV